MTKAWMQMIRKFENKETGIDQDAKFMQLFGLRKNGRLEIVSLHKEKKTR